MPQDLIRSGHCLQGVPEYDAASESFSDVRALSAALRFLGEDADPDTVLAVTGEAFRSVTHAERWTMASAYVSPEPVLGVGARAFGYQPRSLIGGSADETWLFITDAIDQGRPVLSSGILAQDGRPLSSWWFLVRGYDPSERTVLLTGLFGAGDAFVPLPATHGRPASWSGVVKGIEAVPTLWAERPVFSLSRKVQPPEPRERALEAVHRAIRLSRNASVTIPADVPQAGGRYVMGLASFQTWADRLDALTGREPFFERDPFEGPLPCVAVTSANQEQARRIRDGRHAAERFLRHAADLFTAPTRDALLSAAAGYADVSDHAQEFLRLFDSRNPLEDQDLLHDRENRRQGVLLIRAMAALEAAVVAQLARVIRPGGERGAGPIWRKGTASGLRAPSPPWG